MTRFAYLLVAGVAAFAAGTASAQTGGDDAKRLTAEEVKALRGDNTLSIEAGGRSGAGFWKADGTVSYKSDSGYVQSKGTFQVTEDGRTCVKWENPQMKSRCVFTQKDGDAYQEIEEDGSKGPKIVKVVPGNQRGL
jgi:hypothetical protein